MFRLFVAIRPPSQVRDALLDLMGGISGARWQNEDQLHLTLRFIGEVDRHQAEDIHAALGSIHRQAFELALSGLGMFDRRGVPTTIWAGVSPAEPVHTLHKKVDQAIARVGIAPDRRAFHPHITLARLGRDAGRPGGFLAQSATAVGEPFRVAGFSLYESRLMPDGAIHTELETYPLA
jgi:RNA 2',3'-cyclic 3'-phosphodiesterase